MPLLLVLGALLAGAFALGRVTKRPALPAHVGAAGPPRPPLAYAGDPVFALPQRRWGVVECVANAPGGGRYGVRFPSGNAVVLAAHELVR